jgi:phenylpropionate dioxygenase-like ring-hydroxylating dioxygenase large terminal subunit
MTTDYTALIEHDRVHGSLYVDADVYDDETDRIFTRGWVFVGHESEVPEPGQWVTRRLGREPVIMVRDRGGHVNVLANRCAHRGTALCWEPCGRSNSFPCTYHAWTYGLDGALRAVPYPGGFHGDKASLGLDRPGQVEEYRGFVFANVSGDAPPLAEHLGPRGYDLIDRLCDLAPTGRIRVDGGWIGHRVASNWKMWPESDNDGYHLNWVHASMVKATPDTYYQDTILGGEDGNQSLAVDHGRGHIELDFRPSYRRELAWLGTSREKVADYCADLVAARGAERAERLLWDGPPHALIFPNLFLGELNLAIIEPLGPDDTVHRHTAVQFDGVDESFNRRLLRQSEAAMGPAGFIVADDAVTAERMQYGFAASRAEWARAGGRGKAWIDLSRGAEREETDSDGVRRGRVSDETTNRGFWRQYLQVMTER